MYIIPCKDTERYRRLTHDLLLRVDASLDILFHSTAKTPRVFAGDARHRRLVVSVVCSVETGNQFVKRFHLVFANKAIPSPYANAFGLAPAVA